MQSIDPKQKLIEFSNNLKTKLQDPSKQVPVKLVEVENILNKFFQNYAIKDRVKFVYIVQKEIQNYLENVMKKSIVDLRMQPFNQNNSIKFIDELCEIWENYERFIFGLKLALSKGDNFLKDFYKISTTWSQTLKEEDKNSPMPLRYRNQIAPIPVMGVNKLRQFMQANGLKQFEAKFMQYFSLFVKQERDNINIPRQKLNIALQFFESMHFDHQCDCFKRNGRIRILKENIANIPETRRSTSNIFFENTFEAELKKQCQKYYINWVDQNGLNMNCAQQIKQILIFTAQEQERAKFYIHDPKNQRKYIQTVDKNLIIYKFQQRATKQSGFKRFLQLYEFDKPEMVEQITSFWKVVKRVFNHNETIRKTVLSIYEQYLREQTKKITGLQQKPPEFIQATIQFNKKNIQIIKMLDKTLDFDRIRVDIMQQMLAMKFSQKSKTKDYHGGKHWAGYLNSKLKVKYNKTQNFSQNQLDIVNLFKLITNKTVALNEHAKHLSNRLLQEIDMSLQTQYSNAIDLQTKILDEVKKQTSENDIKSIQSCLKDLKASYEQRIKLKQSPKMKQFVFFNQLIMKSGNHWYDTLPYDIQPPKILINCLDTIRQVINKPNFSFQFQNGNSLFTGTFAKKQILKFQLKNIYLMILFTIDQQPNKKMFFNHIINVIKPVGASDKSRNELIKHLIELSFFGILKCSKQFKPDTNIWQWDLSQYFEINRTFEPPKKLQCYKNQNLTVLPDYIKKAFAIKFNYTEQEQRKIQIDRRLYVEARCVKLLKHSQANKDGKGTSTLDQLIKGQNAQSNVNNKYIKQIVQSLINKGYCERVDGTTNVYKYKA